MIVSLIAAKAKNGVIGKDGGLPWHLPEDLKYFQKKTKGHAIIMGRKTFDEVKKPLPNRQNIIITRQKDFRVEGAQVFGDLLAALNFLKRQFSQSADQTQSPSIEPEIFIVGGEQIYRQAFEQNCVDRIYLTEIDQDFEGDTYFPELDRKKFKEVSRESRTEPFSFCFVMYEKIQ